MSDTIRLIAEFFAACVGTIAFALLFQVPRKYYLYCGLAGACGWICYKLILPHTTEPVPGNGISDCGYFPAGAGKRHLLDCFLRGNQ